MTKISIEDMPLGALLSRAEDLIKQLDDAPSADQTTQNLITQGLACLERASALVDSLGLISSNDEKDDVQTSTLRFLFIPHLHANLLCHTSARDVPRRLAAINTAQRFHRYFLLSLQHHAFITPSSSYYRIIAAALEDDGEAGSAGGGIDATTLRQLKVDRFKQEKQIQARLAALSKNQGSRNHGDDEDEESDGDEQEERTMWLLKLDLAALKSAEEVHGLKTEVEVLKHMVATPKEERDAVAAQAARQNAQIMAHLRQAAAGLSGPNQREQLRAQVFRPSHILPTLTVEQQGEIELAEALQRQKLADEAAAQQAQQQEEAGSDDDQEVYKQRAWDEFKDDNPTGWGNSKLRPCG